MVRKIENGMHTLILIQLFINKLYILAKDSKCFIKIKFISSFENDKIELYKKNHHRQNEHTRVLENINTIDFVICML